MEVESRIQWKNLLKDLKKPMILILFYNITIAVVDYFTHMAHVTLPISLLTVPGTVIGLLLAFRTNSAYDRWWEGRKVWGQIVNDCRTLTRQLTSFTTYHENPNGQVQELVRSIVYRQIAWCYVLCRTLRLQPPWKELSDFVSGEEFGKLKDAKNIPNSLLQTSAMELQVLVKKAKLDSFQYMQIDATISSLTDSMGKNERIKNTIFPVMYSRFLDILIYLYILSLPFSMVDTSVFVLIPASLTLSFAFLTVDRIAFFLQDPFDNCTTDIPMYTISRNIEINLRQQLGEEKLPEPMVPINGVLM